MEAKDVNVERSPLETLASGITTIRCVTCDSPIDFKTDEDIEEVKCTECGTYLTEREKDAEIMVFESVGDLV